MIVLLLLFIVGIGVGYLLRHHKQLEKHIQKLTNIVIFALLFLLGLSVGVNETIIENLFDLGLKALIITLFVMFFSILIAAISYKFIFRKNEE